MKTEIDRRYASGFLLSEQDLRRIAQSAQEHAPKIGARDVGKISAKLKDGSLVESESLEDALALENGGQKSVVRLAMQWDNRDQLPKSSISVEFQDGAISDKSWNSISLSVIGDSRDAVFVAAADLDERIKKTTRTSWPYFLSRPILFAVPMLFGLFFATLISNFVSPSLSAVDQLESAYKSGQITNPIEALILLERHKATPGIMNSTLTLWLPLFLPYFFFAALVYLTPRLFRSYVFYWGDTVIGHDKWVAWVRLFWTIIVLGVLVSIAGGLILRVVLP
jgi:hypothetical protein